MTRVDNSNSQLTAAVMASVKAKSNLNQHGLRHNKRPHYIKKKAWSLAKETSYSSNLNFNYDQAAAASTITDYLTDRYNLTGADTGHRAWILSTRLSTTGFGAARGKNGCLYSVNMIANIDDVFRAPSQAVVSYPSSGVFPIELLNDPNIAWSLYLSYQKMKNTPKITITDLDTGTVNQASQVKNYSRDGYGNFKTIITYSPGNTKLVAGHQYQVNVNGIYTYNFKLFNISNQNQQLSTKSLTSSPKESANTRKLIQNQAADLLKAQKQQDQLNPNRKIDSDNFGRSYQDGKQIYNLGPDQWFGSFYQTSNPNLVIGSLKVPYYAVNLQVYSSPYPGLQRPTMMFLKPAHSYAYSQIIQIGKQSWYYLGPHKWVCAPTGYNSRIDQKSMLN